MSNQITGGPADEVEKHQPPPVSIWLQLYGDSEPGEFDGESSWCQDKIYGDDVEYVLRSVAESEKLALQAHITNQDANDRKIKELQSDVIDFRSVNNQLVTNAAMDHERIDKLAQDNARLREGIEPSSYLLEPSGSFQLS